MKGYYRHGCGKAHKNNVTRLPVFHCNTFGTFNVEVGEPITKFKPTMAAGLRHYWLVRLEKDGHIHYGWVSRDDATRSKPTILEIVTKRLIDDTFRSGEIDITILEPWGNGQVKEFVSTQKKWFQSFSWGPRRADSHLVWSIIDEYCSNDWPNRYVLDYGCCTGYYSFQSSKAGAEVIGYDTNLKTLATAQQINDHIEMQDVRFVSKDPLIDSDIAYDHIFYLSVHHQIDPTYRLLRQRIQQLASRCRNLFLELIMPPMFGGGMSESEVDAQVGGTLLHYYKHNVRGWRKVYYVKGDVR